MQHAILDFDGKSSEDLLPFLAKKAQEYILLEQKQLPAVACVLDETNLLICFDISPYLNAGNVGRETLKILFSTLIKVKNIKSIALQSEVYYIKTKFIESVQTRPSEHENRREGVLFTASHFDRKDEMIFLELQRDDSKKIVRIVRDEAQENGETRSDFFADLFERNDENKNDRT